MSGAIGWKRLLENLISGVPLYPIRIDEWLHRKHKVIEFFHQFGKPVG